MKVIQPPPAQGDPGTDKTAPAFGTAVRKDQASSLPAGRSFASVLDSVVADGGDLHEDPPAAANSELARSEAPPAPEKRPKAEPDEDRITPIVTNQVQVSALAESLDTAATPTARQILPPSDLEAIAVAVRIDLVGGQPQVTLDLPRSVLQGLQVKLSADRIGRISVEFSARSESVRSQVAARSTELIDMLRFRGIEVTAFRTSISGDPAGHNRQHQPQSFQAGPTETATGPKRDAEIAQAPDDGDEAASQYTYRA